MPAALPSVLWSPPFPESSTSSPLPQDALSAPELHTRHLSRSHSALGAAGDAARCPHFPAEEPGEDLRGWGLALSRPPPCASQAWCRPQPSFPASRGHPLGGTEPFAPVSPIPGISPASPSPAACSKRLTLPLPGCLLHLISQGPHPFHKIQWLITYDYSIVSCLLSSITIKLQLQ